MGQPQKNVSINGKRYRIDYGEQSRLGPGSYLGYVSARIYDSSGKDCGNISISRLNYSSDKAHRAAIRAALIRQVEGR